MAKVSQFTLSLGYKLPNVNYGAQEGNIFLNITDIEEGEDVGALVREGHRFMVEHLVSTINHGAVQPAGAEMFKLAQLREKDLERPLFFDLTVGRVEEDYQVREMNDMRDQALASQGVPDSIKGKLDLDDMGKDLGLPDLRDM